MSSVYAPRISVMMGLIVVLLLQMTLQSDWLTRRSQTAVMNLRTCKRRPTRLASCAQLWISSDSEGRVLVWRVWCVQVYVWTEG